MNTMEVLRRTLFPIFAAVCMASALAGPVDFVRDVRPILVERCYSCHGADKQKSGLRLDARAAAFKGGEHHKPNIVPGNAKDSKLIRFVTGNDEEVRMPPKGEPMSPEEITTLTRWIDEGAKWPDGVDLVKLKDPNDHWSFKALKQPGPPATKDRDWPRHDIDRFILSRLEHEGLQPSREADRVSWLRRVSFDLVGLPPSPKQVAEFLKDDSEHAFSRVVDDLLSSPRYGERWAQHWLDVVRYADTHGFEVNTERPNAWPYRDYVIAAFNNDTPYDQFIREQLAGDAYEKDAATGFMVTAADLLPGQIGKDDASKRLARQDELGEIVINVGEAFLGLSIGCARCHDHKFDPISALDYYSMQAFFAGVDYGDRELNTPEARARRAEAKRINERTAEIDRALTQFVPLAQPGTDPVEEPSPRMNSETFAPLTAKFVRFTVYDANLHPSLGLIEPCIDEFEIFTSEVTPRNVALSSFGTKVTASGSRTSSSHRLEHINDGRYGNSRSWMSDQRGQGWVLFELPEPIAISKIVWGRDRLGKYKDRLATSYKLEAGNSLDSIKALVSLGVRRAPVNARMNTDRFKPVKTRRVRFSVLKTNNREPCVDEIEVFDSEGRNVALASEGTTTTSSGDTIAVNRHELRFLNDGEYGNSRSWMSNEVGKGWVELVLEKEHLIERVVWGRDRQEKFSDRLAIEYRIEVTAESDEWRVVADSSDRVGYVNGQTPAALSLGGLSDSDAREANILVAEKATLRRRLAATAIGQKAFAGKFKRPQPMHLLARGDPEQPKEEVQPSVLTFLGNLKLEKSATDQARRIALADWIARPENPLTARVMVNRIWQWHFGIGLVETANDFGNSGVLPSHPKLLDWLASEFIRSGWSIKQLHRQIVLSATYRQSSSMTDALVRENGDAKPPQAIDSDARLLWRFPSRRLEAEGIRDTMLAVSGRLNLQAGGPGFNLFKSRGGLSGFPPVESFKADGLRRMIYAHRIRMEREAVFGAFDCPDAGQSAPRRRQSTTPIQALNLLNSRFTVEEADAFAKRIEADVGTEIPKQLRHAWNLAFSREPDPDEIHDAESFVREHGLPTLCRVLFNTNEFLFLP